MPASGVASPAADRLYCPPPRRHLLNKQQEQQLSSPPSEAAPNQPAKPPAPELRRDRSPSPLVPANNLESFIAATAVRVPARPLPQASDSGGGTGTGATYYELADLWEAFVEWSAYGTGVPLLLNGTDNVVQYYVPFLSAIQLYEAPPSAKRQLVEDSDGDSAIDTSSDSDNDRFFDMTTQYSADNICNQEEGFSSDDSESGTQLSPAFQYMEHNTPYGRQPLADMISVFASKFPDLNTYRSCDLLPSSWISVAWYPIYRIPTGPTLQDLDACFLTFHSLSTPLDGMLHELPETNKFHESKIADIPGKITLPLIGLASYKLNSSLWMSNQHREQQLTTSLLKAAADWLCQRQVDHPDYRFFLSH